MLLTTIVNLVLGGLLVVWFLWWRRMSAHLERFREARSDMSDLMTQLQDQLTLVQKEMAGISAMARTTVPGMHEALTRGESLLLELKSVAGSGERVAARIEEAARQAQALMPPPIVEQTAAERHAAEPAPPGPEWPAPPGPEWNDGAEAARLPQPSADAAADPARREPRKRFRGRRQNQPSTLSSVDVENDDVE